MSTDTQVQSTPFPEASRWTIPLSCAAASGQTGSGTSAPQMLVVLNWFEELKTRAPRR
jgi:hypothetical protein